MTQTLRSEPSNRLPIATRTMWWCEAFATALLPAVGLVMFSAGTDWFAPALAVVAASVVYAIVVPLVRYRRWRWELHEEDLDLLRGAWRVIRTIVPITRIQHVSVERTGWTNAFDLVRLHVHTAAGKTTIPGLEGPQADELRDRILAQLRTPDDL